MTSLGNRFEGLLVTYVPFRPRAYYSNPVALGFINAMKLQALQDCDEHMTSYIFTDTEYGDSEIRLQVHAVAGAPQEELIRCNILYAIKTLAIRQLNVERLYGARFAEYKRGRLLYSGVLDDRGDVPLLEQPGNVLAKPSETITREKRALSSQVSDATNSTTTILTIPGSNDNQFQIEFSFQGRIISKISIFSAILEFMMALAQRDSYDSVIADGQVTSSPGSSWIFVRHLSQSRFPLQVFQLLAILEAAARNAVLRRRYQEMTFDFLINGEIVARGCVTAPISSRRWCEGMW